MCIVYRIVMFTKGNDLSILNMSWIDKNTNSWNIIDATMSKFVIVNWLDFFVKI